MVLRHWDPFHGMLRTQGGPDRYWNGLRAWDGPREPYIWAIPVDVVREDDEIVVRASMPGIDPDNIEVSVEDNLLTIKGSNQEKGKSQENGETREPGERKREDYLLRERRTGSFRRTLRLPKSADPDNARLDYDKGVLTVSFPKLESKKAKRLKVSTGAE